MRIEIAGIPIILKGENFLRLFRPAETHLIRPFLKKYKPGDSHKNKEFIFNLTTVTKDPPRFLKIDPELIRKIKSCFPGNSEKNPGRPYLNFFFKRYLPFYLDTNAENRKKITRLFKEEYDYNKIMMAKYAFVIFDGKNKRGDLVYNYNYVRCLREYRLIAQTAPCSLNSLRLLFKAMLNHQKDGIMLHASSAERDGLGYAFVGQSGAGKSTVAKMLGRTHRILSDETTIMRKTGNSYKIFSNPWWNADNHTTINNSQKPAQLKAVFFIKKSDRTGIRKLDCKESLARLIYGDSPFKYFDFIDNKSGIRNFYLFARNLLKDIPSFELNIKKGKDFKEEFNVMINRVLKNYS